MGKQGGQGKGKTKLKEKGFGRALIRNRQQSAASRFETPRRELISQLDHEGGLDEYLKEVELQGENIEVLRVHSHDAVLVEPTTRKNVLQSLTSKDFEMEQLSIPRRPLWTSSMTAEEVDRNEKDAFLRWRRNIADMEEATEETGSQKRVTPFEKNLEVWRQLWRVVERCDMAIQIVDARNPLLYYTEDLVKYAAEIVPVKPVMLIINKADFLTEYQRDCWAETLEAMGIKFIYYSAKSAQDILDSTASESEGTEPIDFDHEDVRALSDDLSFEWHSRYGGFESKDRDELDSENLTVSASAEECEELVWGDEYESLITSRRDLREEASMGAVCNFNPERSRRLRKVLTRDELILLLTILPQKMNLIPQARHNGRICVGLVGYPNVGKSSVINTLLGVSKKSHGRVRVAVSSTPGRTKHFQTLMINDSLMLCDCPGLVFPSFMSSHAEMICAGILPINNMRDADHPAAVIASRVPRHLLEAAYGMRINRILDFKDNPDRPPTGSEVLCAYAAVRGYITSGTGRLDEFRSCKEILRDFANGKILFVAEPPRALMGQASIDFTRWIGETEKTMMKNQKVSERIAVLKIKDIEEEGIVFGDGKFDSAIEDTINEVDGVYLSSGIEAEEVGLDHIVEAPEVTTQGLPRREHKKIKTWGKKNKKLRKKFPYEEVDSIAAYSTNRASVVGLTIGDNRVEIKPRRHDPIIQYGVQHTRPIMPHHPSAKGSDPLASENKK